ncbi:MAG: hypothetical protein C0483_16740 [Pirellula sp.]|nr:hypothetical protein [Pirellula sp.]
MDVAGSASPASGDEGSSAPSPLSTRWPLIWVAVYWIGYGLIGLFVAHMFHRFLARLGLALVCALAVVVWWLRLKRFSLRARLGIAALVIATGAAATLLLDHTVMAGVAYHWSLPLVFTFTILWLTAARRAAPAVQLAGLAVAVVLAWLPGPLVRMEGLNGDGSSDVYFRWSESSEERFLAALPQSAAAEAAALGPAPLTPAADDWPQFRGPAGDARVPGLKITADWERAPPKLVWKHAIGPAWSSVIVVGERLFTQEQRGEIEALTCYAAADGKQLWAYETRDRFEEALGGVGPRATPAYADGRVYALSARGRLDCVDATSGKLVWSVDAMQENEGKLPMWGYSDSPVVVDGKVIVFLGGEKNEALVAYDAATGKRAWTVPVGIESYASPQVLTLHGVKQVLYLGDTKLVSVVPATGAILWEFASSAAQGRPCVQPQLVGENRLLISFVPENLQQIEVKRDGDKWSAAEVWHTRDIRPDYSDFVVYDGYIYGFDADIFCCTSLETGKRQWKKGRYGAGQALLLPDVPAVLVTTEQGELVLLACDPKKSTELARLPAIEGKTWNHQTISRGKLYVRNAEQIACYQLPTATAPSVAAK